MINLEKKCRKDILTERIDYYRKCIDIAEKRAIAGELSEEENKHLFEWTQRRMREIANMEEELNNL
jgi:transcription elongation factor Elf1